MKRRFADRAGRFTIARFVIPLSATVLCHSAQMCGAQHLQSTVKRKNGREAVEQRSKDQEGREARHN